MLISQSKNNLANDNCNYPATPLLFKLFDRNKTNVCEMKLDRITITGSIDIQRYLDTLKKNNWIQGVVNIIDSKPDKYNLFRGTNSIATLSKNKYYSDSWRMDTSNHLTEQDRKHIIAITKLFKKPRITRLDIAVDFINFDDAGMIYRLYKPNTSSSYFYSRTGKIETIYAGKAKSLQVYRYYDKMAELKRERIKIPDYIKNWERLELQLRPTKNSNPIKDWKKRAINMVECLFLPEVNKSNVSNFKERAMINELLRHPNGFNELSSATRAKYRKKIRELHKKNIPTRIEIAKKAIKKNAPIINKEIEAFLNTY